MNINKIYIQNWILERITKTDFKDRYLFIDLNSQLIDHLYDSFSSSGSLTFLNERYMWFLSNTSERINFTDPTKVSYINTQDLLEARNRSENYKYLVFVPNDSASNDSLDSTAETIAESDKSYVDFVINNVLIDNYSFEDQKLLFDIKDYYFDKFKDETESFFYKEVEDDLVLEFFGILGEEKHFNSKQALSSSQYYTKFITPIKIYLYEKGFNGLLNKLKEKDVSNAETVIQSFKEEKDSAGQLYEQAKDFLIELDLVFLRNTSFYKSIIDVDKWILALEEDVDDKNSFITFDNRDNEEFFGAIDIANKLKVDKTQKYLLQRENLIFYLNTQKQTNWGIGSSQGYIGEEFQVSDTNSLLKITTKIADETKNIQLANYSSELNKENYLDFGVTMQLQGSDESSRLDLKLKATSRTRSEEIDLKSIYSDISLSTEEKELSGLNVAIEDIKLLTISDKSLKAGSSIDFNVRTIHPNTSILYLGFQDKEGDLLVHYDQKNEIVIDRKSVKDNPNFYDNIFNLENINEGDLYIQLYNSVEQTLRWIFIEIQTKGAKEELLVQNHFKLLQAKNDSALKDKNIQVKQRKRNLIHEFYFEPSNHAISYYPSAFYVHENSELISEDDECPIFSVENLKIQFEFRPNKNEFESVKSHSLFNEYLEIRNKINERYKTELRKSNIHSIDEIDFENIITPQEATRYLKTYTDLVKEFEIVIWLDMFYLMEELETLGRLDNKPLALFYSPFNPILLYQLSLKSTLFKKTINEAENLGPNSLSASIQINDIENWVIHNKNTQPLHYCSVETDSILFTGFVEFQKLSDEKNNLAKLLKTLGVEYNPDIGHLSPSQVKSALNKSYSYLSNKTVFDINLVGQLYDSSTNKALLDWIESKTNQMHEIYDNFQLLVNIYDNRDSTSYPNSNILIYYKDELGLNFNWFKGSKSKNEFDLTLITSMKKDLQVYTETNEGKLSKRFSYKGIINYGLNRYAENMVYSDIFTKNVSGKKEWSNLNDIITNIFKNSLVYNQFVGLLRYDSHETEVLAISSDVLNSQMMQEAANKSLWEFSISDYSYDDNGRGDYYLLAKEQEVYANKLKKFLIDVDPAMEDLVDLFLIYSKQTGLFELKYLISNDNFLKGFIATVIARKLMDCAITKNLSLNNLSSSSHKVFVSYDVFKDRLHKIKSEINPKYDQTGTQFPDFVLIEFGQENGIQVINFRLVEIKYRTGIITETGTDSVTTILNDQTLKIKQIFIELNELRTNGLENGLWNDTLSLILAEFVLYFNENSKFQNTKLVQNFHEVINSDYEFRLNDSLLICVDGTPNVSSGSVEKVGVYYKIPRNKIHETFNCESDVNKKFSELFDQMGREDTSNITEKLNDSQKEKSNSKIVDDEKYKEQVKDEKNVQKESQQDQESIDLNNNEENEIQEIKDEQKQLNDKTSIIMGSESTTSSNDLLSERKTEVILGKDSRNRKAIYDPKGLGASPLPNYNIMVTGSSGKGKTQFIKSLIYQQSQSGTSFTVIDFKNDYSDEHFCKLCNATKIEVKFDGVPYNPLIPRLGIREDGVKYYDVSEHINAICAVLANTFGLGIQQEADLKKAVRIVYKSQGINPRGILKYDESIIFPSFNDVGDYLEEGDKELEKLYNRLDPLFDLNLFRDKYKNIGFTDIIEDSNIIKVSDIQNDKIKNAIAKMIIVSAHGYYLGIPHSYSLNKLFVFDEAHRVLDSDFVEKFIRECRSFGVGLLLSSQQPDDFPENVLGQLATKIIHGNDGDARLTKKIKSLISFKGDDKVINNLETFDAILNSQDYENWEIDTLAWPQLILLLIITKAQSGINLSELIAKSKEHGINKDWEDYLQMLIQKDYVRFSDNVYTLTD